jgi:hypothetical protein
MFFPVLLFLQLVSLILGQIIRFIFFVYLSHFNSFCLLVGSLKSNEEGLTVQDLQAQAQAQAQVSLSLSLFCGIVKSKNSMI